MEASWNNQGQQNLGLAAAIDPALKAIYGAGDGLNRARIRALDFFNTNPIASGLAIGVVIRLECEVAAGRLSAEERMRVSASLNRTLAAMGDALFWQSWLPLCGLAVVWVVLSLGIWWAPLLLPALFCLPAAPIRLAGLYLGWRQGRDITDLLFRLKVQRLVQSIKRLVALTVGASTVVLVNKKMVADAGPSVKYLWIAVGVIAAMVIFFRFLTGKTRMLAYWYPLVLVTVAAILLAAFNPLP